MCLLSVISEAHECNYFSWIEYSAYQPALPLELRVSNSFGHEKVISLEGSLPSEVFSQPTLTLINSDGTKALTIVMEPLMQRMIVTSDLKVK